MEQDFEKLRIDSGSAKNRAYIDKFVGVLLSHFSNFFVLAFSLQKFHFCPSSLLAFLASQKNCVLDEKPRP